MVFKRFYNDSIAQASFLIGCPGTGEAIVVDPTRDIDTYIDAAVEEGLQIVAVTETHIHADYLSGSLELAQQTGARLMLSAEGGEDWQYAFAEQAKAVLLRDGDRFRLGGVEFTVMHTPGHTPEHITFLVTDTGASPDPVLALTGDFIFVGDVGRPDLLESAAGFVGTMEAGAKTLYQSLQRFKRLPEYLLLYPGHGAGSACGKALGGSPATSLGYELRTNWGLQAASEEAFVREVLSGQPEPPTYFAMMKKLNKLGPALLGGVRVAERAGVEQLEAQMSSGALVFDLRPIGESSLGYVPGTITLPYGQSFLKWAGWFANYDHDIVLIVPTHELAHQAAVDLSLIGLDRVAGWYQEDIVRQWIQSGRPVEAIQHVAPSMVSDVQLLDVRNSSEWREGHAQGATHIPLGMLLRRSDEIPSGPIGVYCHGGGRSAIAVSVLKKLGVSEVVNIAGGFTAMSRQSPQLVATG